MRDGGPWREAKAGLGWDAGGGRSGLALRLAEGEAVEAALSLAQPGTLLQSKLKHRVFSQGHWASQVSARPAFAGWY